MKTVTINTERLNAIAAISLGSGKHDSFDDGMCVMEAASYIAGEPWSDHPACACPVITAFMVSWNDGLPNDAERDRLLKPLIPLLINTKATKAIERRRAVMAADWYIRVQTPAWLRLAGLTAQADAVAALPEITDFLQCPSLMPVLEAARNDSSAAWSAARAAARAAARSAAESAAWAAARAAAWAAAESAARAARGAAWSAAESAAWSAARSAADSAAWSAAWSALETTKLEIQASALDLVARMIAVH